MVFRFYHSFWLKNMNNSGAFFDSNGLLAVWNLSSNLKAGFLYRQSLEITSVMLVIRTHIQAVLLSGERPTEERLEDKMTLGSLKTQFEANQPENVIRLLTSLLEKLNQNEFNQLALWLLAEFGCKEELERRE
jgi:hypothetical protein